MLDISRENKELSGVILACVWFAELLAGSGATKSVYLSVSVCFIPGSHLYTWSELGRGALPQVLTQRPGPGGEGGSDARRRPRSAGGPPANSLPPRRRARSFLPRRPAGARGSAATVQDQEPPPLRPPPAAGDLCKRAHRVRISHPAFRFSDDPCQFIRLPWTLWSKS